MRTHHPATLLLTTTLLLVAVGATPSTGHATAAPGPGCDRTFEVIEPPQISPAGARMLFPPDLSVASRDAVWFAYDEVGGGGASEDGNYRPWPMRWDGRSVETAPPLPRPRGAVGVTFAASAPILGGPQTVSFDSARHGWLLTNLEAMGNPNSSGVPVGYRWHEDRWTMTPLAVSPNPGLVVPNPADVVSLSRDDAWLVGTVWRPALDGDRTGYHGAHIQHWDGTSWQTVDNPLANQRHALLQAVDVVSPTDIWAVGGHINLNLQAFDPVVMHWDGGGWSVVDAPAPARAILDDVSAAGPDEVWAVGRQFDEQDRLGDAPLVMRWDGSEWTVVDDLPEIPGDFHDGSDNSPPSIHAASATDVWVAVNLAGGQSVLLHWDGSTWRTVETPGPEMYGMVGVLDEIDGTGSDNIWVAGRSWGRNLLAPDQTYRPVLYRLSCDRPGRGSR